MLVLVALVDDEAEGLAEQLRIKTSPLRHLPPPKRCCAWWKRLRLTWC